MDFLEILATILGFISVCLVIRRSIWCWPVGIVMVSIFAYVFYKAKLYSDVGLQFFYIAVQAYGWFYWLQGKREKEEIVVERISASKFSTWMFIGLFFTFVLGTIMKNYTDAALPYWDASTTIFSIVAQLLVTRRILECWIVWFVIDILAATIYAYKGLYPTMVLHATYIGMAIAGFITWRKVWVKKEEEEALCSA